MSMNMRYKIAYKLIGDIFVDASGLMNGEAYVNRDPQEVDYDLELS
jgi:hypothetical protein